jgi:hypothetical protein
MNDWRRALLAFYSIVMVALAVLLIVLAWDDSRQLDINLDEFRLVAFIDAEGASRILFTGLMFMFAWFALITLAMALVPDRQRYRDHMVVDTAAGEMTITADMVSSVIREEVERLPGVMQAFPNVRFTKDSVEPDITLVLEPGTNVTNSVNAVAITAERAVNDRFGVRMTQPGISLAAPSQEQVVGAPSFSPPPPPLAVRRVVRPNDGNLEFPGDDGV